MKNYEIKRNPKELLLMNGCPNCGQEHNQEFVRGRIDEIIRDALTDYHNHILEEIKKKRDDRESMHQSYNDGKRDLIDNILSLLQDTNPKE